VVLKIDPHNTYIKKKLTPLRKRRNEVEWNKCIICQVSTPELLIKMRNVSTNSLIEAMEGRRDGVLGS
jgi:hypothetical protein